MMRIGFPFITSKFMVSKARSAAREAHFSQGSKTSPHMTATISGTCKFRTFQGNHSDKRQLKIKGHQISLVYVATKSRISSSQLYSFMAEVSTPIRLD